MLRRVASHLARVFWPRTNQAQVTSHHIEKPGQLAQLGATQQSADAGDARIALGSDPRAYRRGKDSLIAFIQAGVRR